MTDMSSTAQRPAAPSSSPQEEVAEGRASQTPLSIRLSRYALPAILVLFVVIFSLLEPELFFTTRNLRTILTTQSVLAILAIAVCLPLIIGEFDLSVGANLGLGMILVTGLSSQQGLGLVPATIIALLACTLVGVVNGLFVARGGINAFIVTLGMSTILSGAVLWYSGGNTFSSGLPTTLIDFGRGSLASIPNPVVVLAVVAVVIWFLLQWTPTGRFLHAVGGSKQAARLAGLRVDLLTVLAFTVAGLICGVAGVLEASTLGSGNPTVGPSFLLPAFAAAFLGATAIKPGSFNVVGTVVAVFTIETGIVGLEVVGVPYFVEPVFTGVVLIAAVMLTRILYRDKL